VTVRLDAAWAEGDDVALLGIEESADGGATWRHRVSGAMYGGSRDRLGGLPSVTLGQPDPTHQYRVFIVLAQPLTLGLEIEVA
jgi:hypothetical protein